MPKLRIRAAFEGKSVLVPVPGDSTVGELRQKALERLKVEGLVPLPSVFLAGTDTEVCSDDSVEDTLRDEDAVELRLCSQVKDKDGAAASTIGSQGDGETVQEPEMEEEAAPAPAPRLAWAQGSLSVRFALLSGEHGVVSVEPVSATVSDLAAAIESSLGAEPGATTVELFAAAGEPLGSGAEASLLSMGWPSCGEMKVYGVRRLREEVPEEPTEVADPNEGETQIFVKLDRSFVVSVSLQTDTVQVLKLKVKAKTGVPVLQQRLMAAGRVLREASQVLADLGLKSECNLVLLVGPPPVSSCTGIGRVANFAAGACHPLQPQTSDGLATFYAALYTVAFRLPSPRRPAMLAALRRLTAFPPLIAAVRELLSNRTLLPSHRVALVEGLAALFRRLTPPELPGVAIGFPDQCVMEASLQCWVHILANAKDSDAATDVESRWRSVLLSCALTSEPLVDPVKPPAWWRAEEVGGRPCSRAAVLQELQEEEAAVRKRVLAELAAAPELTRLAAGHPGKHEVFLWQGPAPETWAVRPPPLAPLDFKGLEAQLATVEGGILRVLRPVELKQRVATPALTLHPQTKRHCVYEGRVKDQASSAMLYDPLSAQSSIQDVDRMVAALDLVSRARRDGAQVAGTLSRPPREAIIVLLDTSGSMDLSGFEPETPGVDPVDQSRRVGDVRAGDVVRFRQSANHRGVKSGTTADVKGGKDEDGDVLVEFRGYNECYVQATDLEVLRPDAAEALRPLSRMDTVKHLFNAFSNRSMAYDLPHVVGLTSFHSSVDQEHPLTEAFEAFQESVQASEAGGTTVLYDALEVARKELVAFCRSCSNAPREGILKRIIVLSDGADTGSELSAHEVTGRLQQDGVVVDAIVVGSDLEDLTLRAIAVATGGCAFNPGSVKEALQLFEAEPVLCLRQREAAGTAGRVSTEAELLRWEIGRGTGGWDKVPAARAPDAAKAGALQPQVALNRARANPPSAVPGQPNLRRLRRIMAELARYQKDPHPEIEVFPSEQRMDLWRLLLRGPTGTPYEGGVFGLWLLFPADYPVEAPECRFQTPIYHCNINSSGKVCHSVFDRNWATDMSVRQVLDCVYGLLLAPEPDDPLDSLLAHQYHAEPAVYASQAAEHTRTHAGRSYDEMRAALLAGKQPEGHPEHLVCPITLCLFVDPVSTKYGHTYERAAITAEVAKSSKDPLTRQPLTCEDLVPNIAIRKAVEQYRASTPWWEQD